MQWRKLLRMRLLTCNTRMPITLRLMKPSLRQMPLNKDNYKDFSAVKTAL